jgi:hypothetical protein
VLTRVRRSNRNSKASSMCDAFESQSDRVANHPERARVWSQHYARVTSARCRVRSSRSDFELRQPLVRERAMSSGCESESMSLSNAIAKLGIMSDHVSNNDVLNRDIRHVDVDTRSGRSDRQHVLLLGRTRSGS